MKSFDFNANESTQGCISSILRHILCKNLSKSEQLFDEYEMKQDEKKPPPSPNLVARLMGLETMPVHPYTPKESFVRSRSTNSMERWNGFLSSEMNWGAKPRTSQSFREEPTFLRKEGEEFLVLSFAREEKRVEFRQLKDGKSNMERRIVGQENVRSKNYCKPIQEEELSGNVHQLRVEKREVPRRPNSKKKKKKTRGSVCAVKKVELECCSENSSPVSVLDRHLDADGDNSPISAEDKKPKQEKPRKKPSSPDIKCESYPSTKNELIKISKQEGLESTNAGSYKRRASKKKQQIFSDTWDKICQMAGKELKISHWDIREIWRIENDGEIATVIGEEILDFILYEMVTELSTGFITI